MIMPILNFIVNVQYCYDYLIDQIPVALLLYSHIPTAVVALLFGGFVLTKVRNLSSVSLFVVCFSFAVWCLFDLASWFAFLGSANTMFMWSLLDMISLLMFLFSYYFIYTFISEKDLPIWQKVIGIVMFLPTAFWTFMGSNLLSYDSNYCSAVENTLITNYLFVAQAIIICLTVIFLITTYVKANSIKLKRKIFLLGMGVLSFMIFFFSSVLLVSLYAESESAAYVYNFEIYGLFGMPLLLGFLAFLVVRYRAFDIKLIGAQVLIISLIGLIGSQFLFVESTAARVLIGITLAITGSIGINLIRSVKKEVAQREQIEKQEKELEQINIRLLDLNKQKTEFLGFASHQLRGPLTPIKGYAESIIAGDFGKISDEVKNAAQIIFDSTTTLARVVDDYLNVTRIELGKLKFDFTSINIKEIVQFVTNQMRPSIEKKGLKFTLNIDPKGNYDMKGDKEKLNNQVIANLIDNSFKYTNEGEIIVSLSEKDGKIRFSVKDTGVGIAPDVLPQLFNKFKRATNANKTNIHGTGLGLYIAKEIVTAHNGKIWAESTGEGKGAVFNVEFSR